MLVLGVSPCLLFLLLIFPPVAQKGTEGTSHGCPPRSRSNKSISLHLSMRPAGSEDLNL